MLRSACAIVGLLLVGGGCSWAWPPLGLIVVGAALIGGAVWGYLRESAPEEVSDGPAA